MKKYLYLLSVLAAVCCLLVGGVLPVCAQESDDYYYYKVRLSTKIDGDAPLSDIDVYYALHGATSSSVNFYLTPCSADGAPNGPRNMSFQPGSTEQTGEMLFRSGEPLAGLRLLQDGVSLDGAVNDENEYFLALDISAQQPGLENTVQVSQMGLIEGFLDGGAMILSEPRKMSFTLKFNASPVFTGVEAYGSYFTTQKVQVKDTDLVSVMLDDEPVEIINGTAHITLPGNTNTSYTIAAEDESGVHRLTVSMYKLRELMAHVSGMDKENVTVEDTEDILTTLDRLCMISGEAVNATAEEAAELSAMKAELEGLLARVDEAQAYMSSENIRKTKDITAKNVKLADREALEKAAADLEKALTEYGGNYTDSERSVLEENWARVSEALKAVTAMFANLPKTGDNSHIALWGALLVLAGAAMAALKRKTA